MPDYSKAVIYTIRTGDCLYVGSTTSYAMRKYHHKSNCYNENKKDYNTKLYKTIRENNGEWNMKPHKEFPCENKTQLTIEEERVRREMNADLNMYKCNLTDKEKIDIKKEHSKTYHIQNKEKRNIKTLDKYHKNKEKINKEKAKIIECECGCKIRRGYLSTHIQKDKHMKLMKTI